ncbi:hypothetical protein Fot_56428 [Forsythia ovata]|uniref:Uncharacterized protein n=1 Tax=Forsythia ovata TaxID=205694 RepID=A0ABD1P358_9LAMI
MKKLANCGYLPACQLGWDPHFKAKKKNLHSNIDDLNDVNRSVQHNQRVTHPNSRGMMTPSPIKYCIYYCTNTRDITECVHIRTSMEDLITRGTDPLLPGNEAGKRIDLTLLEADPRRKGHNIHRIRLHKKKINQASNFVLRDMPRREKEAKISSASDLFGKEATNQKTFND